MIYLSLGSNLGNRFSFLREAIEQLKEIFSWFETSIVIETPALLKPNAPSKWNKPYLNMIVRGETNLTPQVLLSKLQNIEKNMGRPADHEKWAPRIIDLDILLWDELIIDTPTLKIPHPELLNRPFWLHLMAMLSPETRIPNLPDDNLGTLACRTNPSQIFTQSFVLNPKLVGIVNITPDSFSDGGCYLNPKDAIQQILKLHQTGAALVEIGAQSTRPGALLLSEEEEYNRLLPVLEGIKTYLNNKEIQLSIDTYSPTLILKILNEYPIAWINDVKGNLSADVLKKIAAHNCNLVAMHSLTIPANPKKLLKNLKDIDVWADDTISKLKSCGFSENRIILDPGIGFGKSAYQSLELLKQIKHLKNFGCPILVGHSRKSYMQAFSNLNVFERDLETIAISDILYRADFDFLRVHNIADHQRFWVAQQSLNPFNYKEQ